MDTKKVIVGIIIAVVVIFAGYQIFKGPSAPIAKGPIKIGLSAPLSGEAASYGEAILGGAELAVKEINDAGGINGRQVELVVEDDQCNSTGASAFQKLVNIDKVVAIVGPLCSAAAGPGVSIAQSAGVPVMLTASAPNLTKTGDYIFRNYPSDAFQGKFAAEYMFGAMKKNKAAVIYVKNDWGQGIKEVFINRFKEVGGEIVFEEGVAQDTKDFRTLLAKIKAVNADAVFLPIYPENAGGALRQIVELGLKIPVLGGDGFGGDEVTRIKEAEGVLYVSAKINAPGEFQNKVKNITGKTANSFTPFIYDGVKIIAEAIKEAKSTEGVAIKSKLASIVYTESVAVPKVEFDENGDLKYAEYDVLIIRGGKIEKYIQ